MRQGQVYVHGILAGLLTEVNSNSYRFEYNQDYLDSEATSGVCIASPRGNCVMSQTAYFLFSQIFFLRVRIESISLVCLGWIGGMILVFYLILLNTIR